MFIIITARHAACSGVLNDDLIYRIQRLTYILFVGYQTFKKEFHIVTFGWG